MIKKSKNIPRPTNKSIGLLIGLSEDKVNQVNNMLIRDEGSAWKKSESG